MRHRLCWSGGPVSWLYRYRGNGAEQGAVALNQPDPRSAGARRSLAGLHRVAHEADRPGECDHRMGHCCCWRCCAHAGGSPSTTCTTGWSPGRRWRWPVGRLGTPLVGCVSPAPPSTGSGRRAPTPKAAVAPPCDLLFVVAVREAIQRRVIGARDLIIDSAPIKAWRKNDPDAAVGHAPAQHPTRFLRGFRAPTLLCRGSGLPVLFLLWPANAHDRVPACGRFA